MKIPSYGTTSDAAWERNRDHLYDYATDNDIRVAIKQAFLVGFDNGARDTVNTIIEWRGSTDRDDDMQRFGRGAQHERARSSTKR